MEPKPSAIAPWAQQPGESERHYAWFRAWLTDAGAQAAKRERGPRSAPLPRVAPRSVERTAVWLVEPALALMAVSAQYDWPSRARAYDDSVLARDMGARLESHEEYRTKEARLLSRGMGLIERAFDALEADLDSGKPAAKGRVRYDLPKLIGELLHYSRLAHGETTASERVSVGNFGTDLDWSVYTSEELATLTALIEKGSRAESR